MGEPWRNIQPPSKWKDEREEGEPYRPSNATEGDGFHSRWCNRCANDDYEAGDYCEILGAAMANEQPKEWIYRNRQPYCTAFVPFELGKAAMPEPRCPYTLEMFNDHTTNPT